MSLVFFFLLFFFFNDTATTEIYTLSLHDALPIPWTATADGGWRDPWLPLTAEAERFSVERQDPDPESTLNFTRRLARLRRQTPALQSGSQRMLDTAGDVLAWERALDGDCWVAAINFGTSPAPLPAGDVALRTGHGEGELAASEGVLLRVPSRQ